METGRVAAVAEEEARRLQAEDLKAKGGFWVRDRNNFGLVYVVPNADPEAEEADKEILGGEGDVVVVGQARTPPAPSLPKSAAPPQQAPGARQSATSAQIGSAACRERVGQYM